MTCYNYNLPYFQELIQIYGLDSTKEIMFHLSQPKYNNFYKDDLELPEIKNHIIIGKDGKKLDVKSLIVFTKQSYINHINNVGTININELYEYFDKSKIDRLVGIKNFDINNLQASINQIVNDSLTAIKNKKDLTYDEKRLLNLSISINDYFGLKKIKYIPDAIFKKSDKLFEVINKLEYYSDKRFLPILNIFKKHNNYFDITFKVIDSESQYNELIKNFEANFYAAFHYDYVNNEGVIHINKFFVKLFDEFKLNYKDQRFNKILIHELVHAYSLHKLQIDNVYYKDLNNLIDYIKTFLTKEELLEYNIELGSPEELLAYIFNNDKFRLILNTIPSLQGYESNFSDNYFEIVLKDFNVKEKTILKDIFTMSINIMSSKTEFNQQHDIIYFLKEDLISNFNHISKDKLSLVTNNLIQDWIVFKETNPSFTDFRKTVIEKLEQCLT